MSIRAAALFLAFAFTALPAPAQGPGGPPPNYQEIVAQLAALTTQVATLQGQVTTLQGQVAKLEGNITAADLVGRYRGFSIQHEVHGGLPALVPASIASYVSLGTATLNADGTGVAVNDPEIGYNLVQGAWTVTFPFGPDPGGMETFTWTYNNGTLNITSDSDGETFSIEVFAGGRVLVLAGASGVASAPGIRGSGHTILAIAARLQ